MKKTKKKNKSRKTLKKVLKITAGIIGLLVVVIAVIVVLNWESISIMLTNRELQGPVEAVPEAAHPGSLPITRGESDWICWRGPNGDGCSTMTIEGQPVLLTFHGKGLAALALEDGKELWNTTWETSNDVNATTPVTTDDLVFITSGYGTGGQLVQVSRTGARVVWKSEVIASFHSDPFIIDGYIYGYSGQSTQNKGKFKCVELRTGIEKWSTNEMGWGTCVYVDEFLLCCDIKGNLFLMKPDPEKFIKVTEMPAALGKIKGAAWTVPLLANGKLYLRFQQKLICYSITQKG